jgi:hypothetical protein
MNGTRAASMVVALIRRHGSTVTLEDSTTRKCIYITDPKEFQKIFVIDGQLPGRSQEAAYFVFEGNQFGVIRGGDTFTFQGVKYVAKDPVWPFFTNDICTLLGIVGTVP